MARRFYYASATERERPTKSGWKHSIISLIMFVVNMTLC